MVRPFIVRIVHLVMVRMAKPSLTGGSGERMEGIRRRHWMEVRMLGTTRLQL